MEGSESEAIFESFNLNPQLFINEVRNIVDDLVDGAFDTFHQEASAILNTDGTNRAADLKKGVDTIQARVEAALNRRLDMWENYCLKYCFVVPDGFVLPDKDEPMNEVAMDLDVLDDQQSDPQLDILRNRLSHIGKENAELNRELQALERQYNMSSHCATSVTEALKPYDQNMHEMFGEMIKTAAELRAKMEKLRAKRMEENTNGRRERINRSNEDISKLTCSNGLSNLNPEDLQQFLDEIKKA